MSYDPCIPLSLPPASAFTLEMLEDWFELAIGFSGLTIPAGLTAQVLYEKSIVFIAEDPDTQDLRQAQKWSALPYTKPEQAARELAQVLSDRVQDKNIGEVLRLSSLIETLSEPLVEAGFEPLLIYSYGIVWFLKNELSNAIIQFEQLEIRRKKVEIVGVKLPIPAEIFIALLSNPSKQIPPDSRDSKYESKQPLDIQLCLAISEIVHGDYTILIQKKTLDKIFNVIYIIK